MSDNQDAAEAHFNANPFDEGHAQSEDQNWAGRVASADEHEKPRAELPRSSSESSTDLSKHATAQSSERDDLALVDTVRSAAHAASRKLHLHSIKATGPSKRFNPTNVRVHVKWKDQEQGASLAEGDPPSGKTDDERAFLWRARDNRKKRNSIAIRTSVVTSPSAPLRRRFTFGIGEVSRGIWKMCSTFPYWEMAFWSGFSYAVGSVLFIIDSAWAWEEVAYATHPPSEGRTKYAGPLCFFIGTLWYQVGATMAYLEAVNDGSFQGSAMNRFLQGHEEDTKAMLDHKIHSFFGHFVPTAKEEKEAEKAANSVDPEAGWRTKHRRERPGSLYPVGKAPTPRRGGVDMGEAEEGSSTLYMTWRWWPSWYCLRNHHVYEIGYLACAIQLFGATLYGVTGIVVLPGILTSLTHWQKEAAYWVPQIVASVCFLTASVLFTLETQERWYRPEPGVLGWWIGIWAGIGSVGFLLCAIFGAAEFDIEWAQYQAELSSTWGSTAYLISSLLQWYEAVNKNPVEELFDEPGEMKSFQVHPI